MKKKLTYLKFLLFALLSLSTHAQTTTFNYMPSTNPALTLTAYGQIQSYQVPAGVTTVKITAAGGTSLYNNNAAVVKAEYTVTPGMYLNILVAGKGYEACGGGGTFVTYEAVNRSGTAGFSSANVGSLILAAGGAGSNAAAPASLAPNPASLTANNGGGTHGGVAGGNGGVNSTDLHPALPETKYGGYGGGGAYGFSGGGGGAGFGGAFGPASTSTYGGGGGFSGGTNFTGGTSWISNNTLGVIAGTLIGNVTTTTVSGNGYVIIEAVTVSGTILAQIGDDADNTTTATTITVAQLAQIVPAITGIVAANQSAYQTYIDAHPNAFGAPATAAEVQAMIDAVNTQVLAQAASDAVLAQIGNEGDTPDTIASGVTAAQLGQILPAITGIVAANQSAYQSYIDAHPNAFSAPATAAEVQVMIDAVNAQVLAQAASDAVLAQIGNEGDSPNTNASAVTVAQLGQILPPINGIEAANQSGYQSYIDSHPNLFSTPATPAEVQAMVTAVNILLAPTVTTFMVGASCGATLSNLSVTIKTPVVTGATGYLFRVRNMATNAVVVINRPVNSFALSNYSGVTFNTPYQVEVSTNGGSSYGPPCSVNTPNPISDIAPYCGATLSGMGQWIYATYIQGITGYRFNIENTATSQSIEYTVPAGLNKFNFNQLPASFRMAGTTYNIGVSLRNTNGQWLPYGPACAVTTPGTALQPVSTRITLADAKPFRAVAYPNPFTDSVSFDINTASEEDFTIKVYDMTGRQVEVLTATASGISALQLGNSYPTGVYNVLLSQGENTSSQRLIKR